METKFLEGPLPEGYRCDFDAYLFNSPQNLPIQSLSGWHSFYALRTEKKLARARVHFHIQNNAASTPYKNPFGSFEFAESFPPKELFDFIKWTEESLRGKGVKKILIKNYPELYHQGCASILCTLLLNLGYSVLSAELSACIKVTPTSLFEAMTSWEKRKSGQIKRSKLRFAQIPLSRVREVYEFISTCREERKQSLSMTFPQMQNVCEAFPENFCLFGVYDVNALVAASISILVNKKILYNFYSGHSKQYDALSPVVWLMEGIYTYCQAERINLIDLGTSALQGRPNFGLLDFKLNLGATPTTKFTFQKVLA